MKHWAWNENSNCKWKNQVCICRKISLSMPSSAAKPQRMRMWISFYLHHIRSNRRETVFFLYVTRRRCEIWQEWKVAHGFHWLNNLGAIHSTVAKRKSSSRYRSIRTFYSLSSAGLIHFVSFRPLWKLIWEGKPKERERERNWEQKLKNFSFHCTRT